LAIKTGGYIMNCNNILGITIEERAKHSLAIQEVLSKHGCDIMARLGLPQQDRGTCSDKGLMILQICADKKTMDLLVSELNEIEAVAAKYMIL